MGVGGDDARPLHSHRGQGRSVYPNATESTAGLPERTPEMRRLAPALALFFLAPLIAEFFLGDFPVTLLPLILPLAPLYGGGALLIREITRRTGRGWPTILVLALAFGVLEEALLTQSLFNPDYLGAHLLDIGFVPWLGIAIPWTIFVLTLHTVWSISTPVAIVEESTVGRRSRPWLGTLGLVVTIVLFVSGSVATFVSSYSQSNHFMASPAQLGISAAMVFVLVVIALRLPRMPAPIAQRDGWVPNPWLVLAVAMAAGAVFMESRLLPVWIGVAVALLALAGMAALVSWWSARSSWGSWHRYALASGALLTYSWHAFTTTPVVGASATLNNLSHVIYAVGALGILWLVAVLIRRQQSVAGPTDVSDAERMVPSTSAPGQPIQTSD